MRAQILLALLVASLAANADGQPVAFVDIDVITMDHDAVLRGQTVIVRDGVFDTIAPAATVTLPADAMRIDPGPGRTLVPGLADMHVHLDHRGLQWLPLFLATGVTTVLNLSGNPSHLELRDRVLRGDVAGPTIYTSRTCGPIPDRHNAHSSAPRCATCHHRESHPGARTGIVTCSRIATGVPASIACSRFTLRW